MRGAWMSLLLALTALCITGSLAASSPLLTTKAQNGGPTIFVDGGGKEVQFKGIGWYGYNLAFSAPENLTEGKDAVSQDFKQIVYRQKQLGFNSIRLAFTFDSKLGFRSPVINYTAKCTVPSTQAIKGTLTPNSSVYSSYIVPSGWAPTNDTPTVQNSVCNSDVPNNATYDRFIWMCNYYISQGFYVNLDYHSNMNQDVGALRNESFANQTAWISNWASLLTDLTKTPANKGKILVDLINEPDGYNLTWEGIPNQANSSLTSYYLNAIDVLYPICPDCLFLVEGGGQYRWCGVNWGNGFITNQTLLSIYKTGYNLSDATTFFQQILSKPWLKQLVLAPHIYCPGVTSATVCYNGTDLYNGLDQSYGYLTVSPGYCANGTCRVFPAILDEFGSTLDNAAELSCMKAIETYANALAPSNTTSHAPLTSWFFWAWQPDSYGTGGLVDNDWRSIMWNKVGALTGGTADFATGMGLKPWYLQQGWSALTAKSNTTVTPVAVSG